MLGNKKLQCLGKRKKKYPWVDSRAIVMEYNLGTFTMEFTSYPHYYTCLEIEQLHWTWPLSPWPTYPLSEMEIMWHHFFAWLYSSKESYDLNTTVSDWEPESLTVHSFRNWIASGWLTACLLCTAYNKVTSMLEQTSLSQLLLT